MQVTLLFNSAQFTVKLMNEFRINSIHELNFLDGDPEYDVISWCNLHPICLVNVGH